ncbi:hypothetical protein Moror_6419 [Moniliophthora roreri MCA 2997]|uniref:Uncharacterized protein n=2 Tax=Moniliophthora roreri TaxID=221103 RepID=V2XVE0_MONRO|nr:hypothetical protein Moror_6419 [Moniliophthora roreri MCA 2997]
MASPATLTKHLSLLDYHFSSTVSFQLAQLDNGISNGTALWLGAQCLSAYLAHFVKPGSTVIELGSGIGLTSLALASLGWKQVIATDTCTVINAVLTRNVANNPNILIRELDWTVDPVNWLWDHPHVIASSSSSGSSSTPPPHFDLILTADTVYEPSLVSPLLRTIHSLSSSSHPSPPVLLCLERRDPLLIDRALAEARDRWSFVVDRIPNKKLLKAMNKTGLKWDKSDWEGVEIYKLTLHRT